MIHRTEYHRFLVTGATGTIGREAVKALLENLNPTQDIKDGFRGCRWHTPNFLWG